MGQRPITFAFNGGPGSSSVWLHYTGLSAEYIERTNLRIGIFRFTKELLVKQGLTVGRLDTRFTGIDKDTAGGTFEFDPSYAAIQGTYTAVLNDYTRRELNFENDIPDEILANLYENWSYQKFENKFVDVAETLRQAMSIKQYQSSPPPPLAPPLVAQSKPTLAENR